MTAREELLRSSVRLLVRDQNRVTASFGTWTSQDHIQTHETIGPVLSDVYRRLQRDADRLYVLLQSYPFLEQLRDGLTESAPRNKSPSPSPSLDIDLPPQSTHSDLVQQGYNILNELSLHYASVHSLATVVSERPIAIVSRASLEGIRNGMSKLIGTVPMMTLEDVTATHQSVEVHPTEASLAGDVLRRMWAPNIQRKNTSNIPPSRSQERPSPSTGQHLLH